MSSPTHPSDQDGVASRHGHDMDLPAAPIVPTHTDAGDPPATRDQNRRELRHGTVKWWQPDKGYGFIHDDGTDVFVHYTAIRGDAYPDLDEGEEVEFELLALDPGQAPQAAAVWRLALPRHPRSLTLRLVDLAAALGDELHRILTPINNPFVLVEAAEDAHRFLQFIAIDDGLWGEAASNRTLERSPTSTFRLGSDQISRLRHLGWSEPTPDLALPAELAEQDHQLMNHWRQWAHPIDVAGVAATAASTLRDGYLLTDTAPLTIHRGWA